MYVYLVFSKTGTLLSRALRMCLRTKYPHVSISLDENLTQMYSFGRIQPNNPLSGGFVQESFDSGVFQKFRHCECAVYRMEISESQYQSLVQELARFLARRDHYKYNILGLFAAGMGVPLKRRNRYFCSQFVSELLMRSSILSSETPPELLRPTDLMRLVPKEIVFEGLTAAYRPQDSPSMDRNLPM
ncbi:MAG: hypothetical protein GX030_09535 [Firmicutes bacterium]|nr:hypothetical protein [Bacillota bacterium]